MRVGYHVNKTLSARGDMVEALKMARDHIESALETVRPAAQIFVHGPKTHDPTVSLEDARKIAAISSLQVIVHGAYPDYPWKYNPKAIAGIREELRLVDEMGSAGLVVHLGQEAASRETLLRILGKIDAKLDLSTPRRIWLETNVVAPEVAIFSKPEELARLMRAVRSRKYANIRVGLCIDTAHLHSCGVRVTTADQAKEFLSGLPKAKYLLHLNDSAYELGAGRDRHAGLGLGHIWREDMSGLEEFVAWATREEVTILLERQPGDLAHDLEVLKKMIKPGLQS